MNNKNLDTVMRIIGTICVNMGAWLLFNSTYTTNIAGDDVAKTIFLSITPNNQLLVIISLVTILLGIIILLKKRI